MAGCLSFDPTAVGMGSEESAGGVYRYRLWRVWAPRAGLVHYVAHNPSQADARRDDPTLAFMCRFARAWGRGGVVVTNLVPYRATEPVALRDAEDPLGEEATPGIGWVRRHAEAAPGALVICCWGVLRWGWLRERAEDFVTAWRFGVDPRPLHHLGLTKGGFPRHPLYLPGDVQPQEWKP